MKKEHFLLSAMMSAFALVGLGIGFYFNSSIQPVGAAATDRNDGVILATATVMTNTAGMEGAGVEGATRNASSLAAVYTLDQNSGHLTAGVLAREGQSFQGIYTTNVNQGLASVIAAGGNQVVFPQRPRYTMVTGEVSIPKQAGAKWQVPQSVLYIHEQTTGYLMVYTIPWDGASYRTGGSQQGEMVLWTAYRFTPEYGR